MLAQAFPSSFVKLYAFSTLLTWTIEMATEKAKCLTTGKEPIRCKLKIGGTSNGV